MIKCLVSFFTYFYVIFAKRKIHVGYPCRLSPFFILRLPKNLCNINFDRALIGRDVNVSSGCTFYDDPTIFGRVKIGRYTSINGPATRICSKINKIEIGSFCSIASNVIIQEYNHKTDLLSTYDIHSHITKNEECSCYTSKGDIIIGNDVWIGSNCTILSGVHIGNGAVIGAGSVVVNDIEPYCIAVGNPARVVKKRFNDSVIKMIEELNWTEWNEEIIRKKHILFETKNFPDYIGS